MELEVHRDGVNEANSLVTFLQLNFQFVSPPLKEKKRKEKKRKEKG